VEDKMKVREFREKYMGWVNYSGDRFILNSYPDVELLAYAACGATVDDDKRYTTAIIFRSARKYMAFVNGYRKAPVYALKLIEEDKGRREMHNIQ
jgi:hypothetical protein